MKKIGVFLILMLLNGCVKDVDFNQVDDIEIKSVYIVSLVHFNLYASDFLDDDLNELTHLEDFVLPRIKGNHIDDIAKIEFTFNFSNSFSRDFLATVFFYDANDNVVYHLNPVIEIEKNTENVETVITVIPPDIETIYTATKAGFFIHLLSDENEVLTTQSQGDLNLKSSLTLYLNVKK